ncbi:HlyD family secretion protein [Methylocapsa aurea]|uniref:HlyD family secretion protein n=1 Tax=Methylocapsa aurea TaxID=663610 RepID=UPI000569E4EC|nr:HlyD family efflux transporter periplasmic adaptor subunit [Methylocapsa aurea]
MANGFFTIRYGIPLFALAMLSFASWSIASKYSTRVVAKPPIAAPASPYRRSIVGSGIVEPASEVIALAIERGGVVTRVDVVAGAKVKAGQPLFAIDERDYRAAVAQGEATIAAAQAAIASIGQRMILQQDAIEQSRAGLDVADAEHARATLDHARYSELVRNLSAPRQRFETAVADVRKAAAGSAAAKAILSGARHQVELLTAQRHEAEAKLAQAKAALEQAQIALDKTVVRAPIAGAILKVNVRLGEYAQAGVLATPLMTMGSVDPLHVRADIDEADASRIHLGAPAVAQLRGNPSVSATLAFVRVEPYVLPKKSLTGNTTERVDTRVLQAIYSFSPKDFPAFVGQQVDVFIETPEADSASQAALVPNPG